MAINALLPAGDARNRFSTEGSRVRSRELALDLTLRTLSRLHVNFDCSPKLELPVGGDTMARKALQNDQIVKLIVGAGKASPSPPVGPALGSKGVKSMDFCKVRSYSANTPQEMVVLTMKSTGVQCEDGKLRARHASARASHGTTRSVFHLRTQNAADSCSSALGGGSESHQEQAQRCWQYSRAEIEGRDRRERQGIVPVWSAWKCWARGSGYGELEACL